MSRIGIDNIAALSLCLDGCSEAFLETISHAAIATSFEGAGENLCATLSSDIHRVTGGTETSYGKQSCEFRSGM